MKIYLQDCKTLKFIRCDSSWSSEISGALDFMTVRRATLFGLSELKEEFQLLKVEADGIQSRVPTTIGKLPVIKTATAPRPVRLARTDCIAREIIERTGDWRSRRRATPTLPAMVLRPAQISWAGDILTHPFKQ